MRNIHDHDVLFSRLKLLTIMAKAYLEDHDFGMWRLKSMIRNTKYLSGLMANWHHDVLNFAADQHRVTKIHLDHILYQRVKLLSIMMKSFAEGNPMGTHRRAALKNNVEYICEALDHLQCVPRTSLHVVK
jgi:hypothetical protein